MNPVSLLPHLVFLSQITGRQIESSLPHINFSYVWPAWLCHTFGYYFRNNMGFRNNVFGMKCVVSSRI